jgi:FkbM family methyltransferase
MEDEPGQQLETEVELLLPGGSTARLAGEAADASILGSIGSHGGAYEPGLMAALEALVTPSSVCLDVGANVGPVSLALGRLCGEGRVHAFEPVAASFAFLERNLASNGAANVTAHRLALSDTDGTATINYNRQAAGAAFISEHLADGVAEQVSLTTLDKWAASARLERLDLLKIDVEGSELQVLDGAAATLRRFRPVLIVELNPVTLRRMQHLDPRALYRRLRSVYGRLGHLAVIPDEGPMLPLLSWSQLRRHLAQSAVCNLACSPGRLLPRLTAGVAGPRTTARALLGLALRYRRGAVPPWAAVVDPHVVIRADGPAAGGLRRLCGPPGARVAVPLIVANRGDVAIVGEAERLPVSIRVVWIDAEGRHRVDDRSRTPAPTLRAGAVGTAVVPLYLPDETGTYSLRITLFQENVAWFYDLDPSNCWEMDVEVSPPPS